MQQLEDIIAEIAKAPRQLLQERSFKKRYPYEYNNLATWTFPEHFKFPQKLYHYLHNDKELLLGVCPICGRRCGFKNFMNGYNAHCSARCSTLDKETQAKRTETCIGIYGETHPNKSKAIKEKAKRTSIGRYGTDNPAKSNKIKEKTKQTNLNKYGTEYYSQTNEYKDKVHKAWNNKTPDEIAKTELSRKTTRKERYGNENYNNRDKFKETCLNRHGNENYNNREKFEQTCKERYGVENVFQLQEVKEKSIATSVEKYGVEYYAQTEECKELIKEAWASKTQEERNAIKNKIRQTNLEKYGVENYSQTNEFKIALRTAWDTRSEEEAQRIKNAQRKACLERYGTENYSSSENWRNKVKRTNLNKYGVEWACMRPEARNHHTISKVNIAFAEQLEANGIEYEMEYPLGSYSYDFKVGNTLIEIDPSITHNSFLNIFGGEPKASDYHLLKTNRATNNGYRCIHIWDWDDMNKIVSMLKPKQTLYARKLELKEVGKDECDEFLNTHHLQGSCRGQTIRLGLYKDNTLVELMTFGKPRYNKNYEYELLRLCTHSDYIVVGGAERLFRHFIEHCNPQSIISYCDASKFNGGVYARNGFAASSTSAPTIHWWDGKTHITDNLLRQRGFDQLFNADYGKGTDNEELMLEHGFLPVYDCGQMRFEWKAKI